MKRRGFLAAVPMLAVAVSGRAALAAEPEYVEYSRAVYEEALASGKPFLLDFFATW